MEAKHVSTSAATAAAIEAYSLARRSVTNADVASRVAVAKYRAYFPLATDVEVTLILLRHFVNADIEQRRALKVCS